MAISRNANPCKEIEIAERLTGKKESGRFKEIPNTIKLRTIDVTKIYKAWNSILPPFLNCISLNWDYF
jgi:hypothetical protein